MNSANKWEKKRDRNIIQIAIFLKMSLQEWIKVITFMQDTWISE